MAPKTSLLYDTFVLSQSIGTMLGQALATAPLGPEEYAIYSHILEYDRCTPSEMSRDINMPLQTVSDWVALLRKRGHLESTVNERDRRSFRISLTAEGRRLHRQTNRRFEDVNRLFLQGLGRTEEEMRAYVQQMIQAAQSATISMGAPSLGRTG
jgi:DNA-binding MarR family transcriptional regulator